MREIKQHGSRTLQLSLHSFLLLPCGATGAETNTLDSNVKRLGSGGGGRAKVDRALGKVAEVPCGETRRRRRRRRRNRECDFVETELGLDSL